MSEGHNFPAPAPGFAIEAPGCYDLPAELYHADPCVTPSLSAGMINDMLACPARCHANSPRLNPDWQEPEGTEKFTIGTVSHVLHLEPHLYDQKVVVLPFDDWRTKEAKAQRAEVLAAGKTPILIKHAEQVQEARLEFLANPLAAKAFTGGRNEQSLFWRHPRHGFWCRARPDYLADGALHLCDYKATGSADPEQFGRHAFTLGYHRRAAWYLEGCAEVFGRRPDHYWFCNQETKRPFLTSVVELDMQALEAGQVENDRAAELFARCLQEDDWPGYRNKATPQQDTAFRVGLPNYAYMQIDQRGF
jgi:hypothetical protein